MCARYDPFLHVLICYIVSSSVVKKHPLHNYCWENVCVKQHLTDDLRKYRRFRIFWIFAHNTPIILPVVSRCIFLWVGTLIKHVKFRNIGPCTLELQTILFHGKTWKCTLKFAASPQTHCSTNAKKIRSLPSRTS